MSAVVGPAPESRIATGAAVLGPLTAGREQTIHFPVGLFGFPDCHSFALVPAARQGLFWLQSLEHGALAFLLVDPFVAFEGYAVDVGSADLLALQVTDASEVAVLAVVTLPATRDEPPTVNLQGPIIFNVALRRGRQAVLARDADLRAPLDLTRLP
jgi:flagellar assembly factor FliW